MVDESCDSATMAQLSIAVRYINKSSLVSGKFIGFVDMQKTDAKTIAESIISSLNGWGFWHE